MFGLTQQRLLGNMNRIKKQICCYGSSINQICDCKYPLKGKDDDRLYDFGGNRGGEITGCCEISHFIHFLEVMTNEEYEDFCIRSGILIEYE